MLGIEILYVFISRLPVNSKEQSPDLDLPASSTCKNIKAHYFFGSSATCVIEPSWPGSPTSN